MRAPPPPPPPPPRGPRLPPPPAHRDGDLVVVQDQGGVDAGELGDGGHGGRAVRGAGRRVGIGLSFS